MLICAQAYVLESFFCVRSVKFFIFKYTFILLNAITEEETCYFNAYNTS
jgi:hypothetical protein